MKMDISSEKENPLMRRKSYWLRVEHAGKQTPNRHELMPAVLKKLGSGPEETVISKIFSHAGVAVSNVKVVVYKDAKAVPAGAHSRQERKVKAHLKKKAEKAGEQPAEGEESAAEEKASESASEDAAEDADEDV